MGSLYVVAEFVSGDVYHFWPNAAGEWVANTAYSAGDVIEPSTPTGFNYRATRLGAAYPQWAANVPRAVSDIVEPTTYNGFGYIVTDTSGDTPASGTTEPTWPTEDGAQITEDTEGAVTAPPVANSGPGDYVLPSDVTDRYGG
jgi:hypothetical protein